MQKEQKIQRSRSRVSPYIPSYLEEGQQCVVCGDVATGLHYRAITCEGCKGFFRRTAQRRLEYLCNDGEKCEINKTNRNLCQRCRFLKCLQSGMSTTLVLNEMERKAKRRLIESNRQNKSLRSKIAHMASVWPNELSKNDRDIVYKLTELFIRISDSPLSATEENPLLARFVRFWAFGRMVTKIPEMEAIPSEWTPAASGWTAALLLRLCSRVDAQNRTIQTSNGSLSLNSLGINAEILDKILYLAAKVSELTNEQIAVLSAFFVLQNTNEDLAQIRKKLDNLLTGLFAEQIDVDCFGRPVSGIEIIFAKNSNWIFELQNLAERSFAEFTSLPVENLHSLIE